VGVPQLTQTELAWRDAESLCRELQERTGLQLRLTITDNASSVMSFAPARANSRASLRLHHMFLAAGPAVVAAVADWLTDRRLGRSAAVLNTFIREHGHLVRATPRRKARIILRTQGQYHDLKGLYDEVNRTHFAGLVKAGITWGARRRPRRRCRSIRFGSFTPCDHATLDGIVRIHPFLDGEFVPRYFVRYIVFHEMLHAFLGIAEAPNGRRRIHPPEFKRLEEAYPDYARAMAWQGREANLRRLLR